MEVILHCLLAAILKISISNATSKKCFVERFGLLSRERTALLGVLTRLGKLGGCGLVLTHLCVFVKRSEASELRVWGGRECGVGREEG